MILERQSFTVLRCKLLGIHAAVDRTAKRRKGKWIWRFHLFSLPKCTMVMLLFLVKVSWTSLLCLQGITNVKYALNSLQGILARQCKAMVQSKDAYWYKTPTDIREHLYVCRLPPDTTSLRRQLICQLGVFIGQLFSPRHPLSSELPPPLLKCKHAKLAWLELAGLYLCLDHSWLLS